MLWRRNGITSHKLTGPLKESIDNRTVGWNIQLHDGIGIEVSEALRLSERVAKLNLDRQCRPVSQRFVQVPEHLMKLPHDWKNLKHLFGGPWGLLPVGSGECILGNFLSGAEAVIDRASPHTPLPEAVVNPAPEVRLQAWASLAGSLVHREVCRSREGQGNTTQSETFLAISLELLPVCGSVRCGGKMVVLVHVEISFDIIEYDKSMKKESST
ncbi:hypothetical protein GCM10010911_15310 [Paenibacillus nasutitermitis]|uniref:Uncharacterized protein n=1 Tax=Paenibacillus nasutitermitis TaxID=1652958 RepID=A0A917DR38_9BACL|nr:hypothetical protein GCM10010911_15310 [Paenibacillus nasutitermitis]